MVIYKLVSSLPPSDIPRFPSRRASRFFGKMAERHSQRQVQAKQEGNRKVITGNMTKPLGSMGWEMGYIVTHLSHFLQIRRKDFWIFSKPSGAGDSCGGGARAHCFPDNVKWNMPIFIILKYATSRLILFHFPSQVQIDLREDNVKLR